MRIGVDIRELERGKMTGIGKYLLNFLEFATKERSNYAFILYGNQHTSLDYKAPNLTLKIIPEMATIWWDQGTLPSLIKKDRIDIFFLHISRALSLLAVPLSQQSMIYYF